MRLPLNERAINERDSIHMKLLEAFDDKLLLFLRRLSSMQLVDNVNDSTIRHRRDTVQYSESNKDGHSWKWTKISSEKHELNRKIVNLESFWYVKTLDFKPTVRRGDVVVENTEISIAVRFKFNAPSKDEKLIGHDVEEGGDKGESTDAAVKIELSLDTNECLYPIYAFLPTKAAVFQFVLQADFLLPASREALKEDDPWNRHLIDKVPDLFVDMIVQIASTVRANSIQATKVSQLDLCSHPESLEIPLSSLLPLPSFEYEVKLSFEDLLSLLPKVPRTEKTRGIYTVLIDRIYSKLCDRPIFKSMSGIYFAPSKLIAISHLSPSFDPTMYLSEEMLFNCTGKRYMDRDIVLDDELMKSLRIDSFDSSTVLKCIEVKLSLKTLSLRDTAGMLLVLHHLSDTQAASKASLAIQNTSFVSKPRLVPSQMYRPKSSRDTASKRVTMATGDDCRKLKETCERLRKLPIWPIADRGGDDFDGSKDESEIISDLESRVSLESQAVFMHGLTATLTLRERRCFDLLPKDLVTLLDDSLFKIAKEIVPEGDKILRKWLLEKFSPDSVRAFGQKVDSGKGGGGLVELSLNGIAINAILPKYASISSSMRSTNLRVREDEASNIGAYGDLNRITACACLAFIFLSGVPLDQAAKVSVIIPLLSAKEKTANDLVWDSPILQSGGVTLSRDADSLRNGERREVHLGIEFEGCATSRLANMKIKRLMQQVIMIVMIIIIVIVTVMINMIMMMIMVAMMYVLCDIISYSTVLYYTVLY